MVALPLADYVEIGSLSVLLFHEKDNSEHSWLVVINRDIEEL